MLIKKLNRPCSCEKPHKNTANIPVECRRNPLHRWWQEWFIDENPTLAA